MDVSGYRKVDDGVFLAPNGDKHIVDEISGVKGNIRTAERMIAAYDRLRDKDDWTGDPIDELRAGLAADRRELEILTALKEADRANAYGSKTWFG